MVDRAGGTCFWSVCIGAIVRWKFMVTFFVFSYELVKKGSNAPTGIHIYHRTLRKEAIEDSGNPPVLFNSLGWSELGQQLSTAVSERVRIWMQIQHQLIETLIACKIASQMNFWYFLFFLTLESPGGSKLINFETGSNEGWSTLALAPPRHLEDPHQDIHLPFWWHWFVMVSGPHQTDSDLIEPREQ
jgi:hypothetical protein